VVREAGNYIYLLAAKREGDTVQVSFSGLSAGVTDGEVLFEQPRHVQVATGSFTDWFGPNEVHVYRFRKPYGSLQTNPSPRSISAAIVSLR
jgi:hypothetical protein